MGLRFDAPWVLLGIVPIIFFFIWSWLRTYRLSGIRKAAAISIRSLVLVLLVCALAGLQWFTVIERQAVIFVVDRSDSMPQFDAYIDWIKQAASNKAEQDEAGVVTVGAQALIERSLSMRDLQSLQFSTQINGQFSNLAAGLQLAGSLTAEDASSRIVLLTDGHENVGDALQQAKLLRDKGIPVDVLELQQQPVKDVAVERLQVPEELYQGEKFTLEVDVRSTYAAEAILRIYEDNEEILSQWIQIEAGENRFALQSLARDPGFHRYRAEIYAVEDGQAVNNVSFAFSRVSGPPKVLIVEGKEGSSQNIISVLESSLIPYDLILPEMLPRDFTSYMGYESMILNNVPATRLAAQQMEMVEQAVRDYGIGLMMLGGEESFGLGGYFQTAIERALPVYMDLRGKREIPSLGLVLVIDKSGSMSGGKMELAKEAAIRTVELLRDQDTIGVLAFDGTPWWVVEPQTVTDREKIMNNILSIQESGGTEIYTALDEGYTELVKVDAQRKHMILLTDGQSATNQSYEQLTSSMADHQMTLSTVAIGDGADVQLLEYLANLGNGRYYYTNDQSTIPAIFSREAVLISRTYIVDQPFVPIWGQGGDWRLLLQPPLPTIHAYIATTAKETAEAVLISPEPDPLLARWQYGAGKSVAWTSDFSGSWSSEWVSWERFPQVFSEILKWTFPQFHATPFQLNSRFEGDRVRLEVTSSAADFYGELKAVITNDALAQREVELIPTLPGQYEAEFQVDQPGVYLTRIDVYDTGGNEGSDASGEEAGDEVDHAMDSENEETAAGTDGSAERLPAGSVTTGFVIPYSPEYRITLQSSSDRLVQLAELTGGRLLSIDEPEAVFAGEVSPKKKYHDLTVHLLVAALLLWLIDIAIRRLSVSWRTILQSFSRSAPSESDHQARSVSTVHAALDRLQARQTRYAEQQRDQTTQRSIEDAKKEIPAPLENINKANKTEMKNEREVGQVPQDDRMNRLLAARKRNKR